MTETLMAIETSYKGFRFRSRLEARWAIYFDAVEMPWQYELEGYNLGELGLYLPDFWLVDESMFAEVKAKDLTVIEQNRCRALAKQSGYPVIMLVGPPEPKPYRGEKPDGQLEEYGIFPGDKLDAQRMVDAIRQSRAARFEHGETPENVAPRAYPAARSRRYERQAHHVERGASAERELIRAMVFTRENVQQIAEKMGEESFREPQYRALFRALVASGPAATVENITAQVDAASIATLEEILAEGSYQMDPQRTIEDALGTLRARDLDLRAAELDRLIPIAKQPEKDALIAEKDEIRKELKATGKSYYKKFRRAGA